MIAEEFAAPLNQMQAIINSLLDQWVGTPRKDIANNIKNIWTQVKFDTLVQ